MANIFDNLKQLSQLRQQAMQFQKTLASKVIEVASPGGEITMKVNGKMELLFLDISPSLLAPEKKGQLEKLLQRTWSSAQREIERFVGTELKSQAGGLPF